MVYMFLNGGGMRGGPVHHHIAGAPLVAETRTAPRYRFYAVNDAFPGLDPVEKGGVAVEGELYDVPWEMLRDGLMPNEPPELELGIIELEDGGASLAMLLRKLPAASQVATVVDISAYGGWRSYRQARSPG
jgi:hypothetical protein